MALRLDRSKARSITTATLCVVTFSALVALATAACDGGAVTTPDTGKPDATIYYDVGGGPDLSGTVLQSGDPCPAADCFSDQLICIGGVCRVKCTQPKAGCNHAATECPVGSSCLAATTFTDACFPAEGKLGDECSAEKPCSANFVCVQVSGPATCVALCSLGCQAGEQCLETSQSCKVCIKQ